MALQQPPGCEVRELVVAVVGGALLAVTRVVALRALGLGDLLTAVPGPDGVSGGPGRARGSCWRGRPRWVDWLASLGVVDEVLEVRDLTDERALLTGAGTPEVAVNLHGRGPAEPPAPRAGCDPGGWSRTRAPRRGTWKAPTGIPTSTRSTGGSACRSGRVETPR